MTTRARIRRTCALSRVDFKLSLLLTPLEAAILGRGVDLQTDLRPRRIGADPQPERPRVQALFSQSPVWGD